QAQPDRRAGAPSSPQARVGWPCAARLSFRGPALFAGPRNLSQTRQGGAVRYGGLEIAAPPSQGEDGAPDGIKVAEERVPAGSYLTNVIKAGPVPANSAKVSSTPVTGRRASGVPHPRLVRVGSLVSED